jgi:hypothetical protein
MNKEAETVSGEIARAVFTRFGLPTVLVADRGSEFTAELQEMCNALMVKVVRTAPYHPEANAQVERVNGALITGLRTLCLGREHMWPSFLPWWGFAFRSAVHAVTGFSPYAMMMGREPRMPLDVMMQDPGLEALLANEQADPARVQASLGEVLKEVWEVAWGNHLAAARDNKAYYDQKAKAVDYPVGTLVWVFRPTRKESESKKLRFAWSGPYRVAERKGNATYKVVWANEKVPLTERQWPELTVHAKNLHRARAYWRPELNVKRVVALPPAPVAEMGAGGAEVELVGARGAELDGRASAAHLEQSAEGAKVVVEPVSENAPSVYVPVPEPEPLRTAVPEAPLPIVGTHAQSAPPGLEVEQGVHPRPETLPVEPQVEEKGPVGESQHDQASGNPPLPELSTLDEEQWSVVLGVAQDSLQTKALRVTVQLRSGRIAVRVCPTREEICKGVSTKESEERVRLVSEFLARKTRGGREARVPKRFRGN